MSFVDPLWEFVLEDYEDEETTSFRRSRDKKRDDKSLTRGRSVKANRISSISSNRGRSTEYRDDKEDGFWDFISGAPPAATMRKRSNSYSGRTNSSKGRSLLSKKSNMKKNRSSSLTRSQSSVSESGEKKKNLFKKRFSWSQNSKSAEDGSMMEYSKQNLDVKHTTLTNRRDESQSFDAMDLLFNIADSLDPWGVEPSEASVSDVESHDGTDDEDGDMNSQYADDSILGSQATKTTASKSTERSSTHARNRRTSGKLDSLLDQQLPKPTTVGPNRYPYHSKQPKEENDYSTEIRLRVIPGGNTVSEEVFKTSLNTHENDDRGVRKSQPWDEESNTEYGPSVHSNALKLSQIYDGVSKESDFAAKEKRNIITTERNRRTSEERRVPVPSDVQIVEAAESLVRGGGSKRSNTMKKAMCGFRKGCKDDSLKTPDAVEVFPSSRVVINGKTHVVTSPESDPMNGIMGASSAPLIGSNGRQSVFAYDYDSNLNMDVSYAKPNQKPRTSISVRTLGPPPPLSSFVTTENVVVQIEASVVSETDCIIRQGLWWGKSQPSYPNTPGIDVVGKVYCSKQTAEKEYGLKPMQTVLSLVKWGGNARFLTMHPKQLVKVPEGLDPAEAACLPECYLSAFQVLHMGQTGRNRYTESSMKGKSILILGSMTNNMGKAFIELALNAGVANIYATAKKKHWKTLISYGVVPLSPDPMQYIQRIAGTMDLVLAPNGNLREDVTPVHFRALTPRYGQLIISGRRVVGNDIPIDSWKQTHHTPTLSCGKNKALQKILRNSMAYDVYEQWEKNLDLCKRDLSHLLTLLGRKLIKPEVLDRIPLNKVGKAHELLESKRLPGFLVCEPWMQSKKHAVYL